MMIAMFRTILMERDMYARDIGTMSISGKLSTFYDALHHDLYRREAGQMPC